MEGALCCGSGAPTPQPQIYSRFRENIALTEFDIVGQVEQLVVGSSCSTKVEGAYIPKPNVGWICDNRSIEAIIICWKRTEDLLGGHVVLQRVLRSLAKTADRLWNCVGRSECTWHHSNGFDQGIIIVIPCSLIPRDGRGRVRENEKFARCDPLPLQLNFDF